MPNSTSNATPPRSSSWSRMGARARTLAVAGICLCGLGLTWSWMHANEHECSECMTQSDCGAALRCERFDDNVSRCVRSRLFCTEGRVVAQDAEKVLLIGGATLTLLAFASVRGREP